MDTQTKVIGGVIALLAIVMLLPKSEPKKVIL